MPSTDTMEKSAEAVLIAAALAWWEGYRPVGWTEAQHRAQPRINCTSDGAKQLAEACALYVGEKEA